MGKGFSGTDGPSYWDVERAKEAVEDRFKGTVLFVITTHTHRFTKVVSWHVRAELRKVLDRCSVRCCVGAHGFRGGGGSSTMSAAMYIALLRLQEAAEDDGRWATHIRA